MLREPSSRAFAHAPGREIACRPEWRKDSDYKLISDFRSIASVGWPLRFVARDVPLSEVLARLARTFDFEFKFHASHDPPISIVASQPVADLVAVLAAYGNVSIARVPNARCPERWRVVSVWVLPSGGGVGAKRAAQAPVQYAARDVRETPRPVLDDMPDTWPDPPADGSLFAFARHSVNIALGRLRLDFRFPLARIQSLPKSRV
jgi:hypothetical protein